MKILLCMSLSILFVSCDDGLLKMSDIPSFAFLLIICIVVGAFLGYLASFRLVTHILTRAHFVVRKKTFPYLCIGGIIGAVLACVISLI